MSAIRAGFRPAGGGRTAVAGTPSRDGVATAVRGPERRA
jgi:hypothetical protein